MTGKPRIFECCCLADEEREASPFHVVLDIQPESEMAQRRRILHRVPLNVRENKKHIYEPLFVSLGPYHHHLPQFRRFEKFKDKVLDVIIENSDGADAENKRHRFRDWVWSWVPEIRSFYEGLSTDECTDEALVEMMLRDACFILYFMEIMQGNKEKNNHVTQSIGTLGLQLMTGDFFMLENQIPWWVIKFLISLIYDDEDKQKALICESLSYINFADISIVKRVPWEEGTVEEPLHLLEALCITCVKEKKVKNNSNTDHLKEHSSSNPTFKSRCWRRKMESPKMESHKKQHTFYELIKRPFRSATELSAKGIYFRPSSNFLIDIKFNSYSCYGVLHLPVLVVHRDTMSFLSNMIVMEMSPGDTSTGFAVTSYVNFMKSLIENPKDAKLLQENGILLSYLEDNEHIVRMFKEIDTYGGDDYYKFNEIKMRINEHCDSKAKTWIAELIITKFRTPWTVIALCAAIFLLCLTFLQTYYTVTPRNGGN